MFHFPRPFQRHQLYASNFRHVLARLKIVGDNGRTRPSRATAKQVFTPNTHTPVGEENLLALYDTRQTCPVTWNNEAVWSRGCISKCPPLEDVIHDDAHAGNNFVEHVKRQRLGEKQGVGSDIQER